MPITVTLERHQGVGSVSDACTRRQPAEFRCVRRDGAELVLPTVLLDLTDSSLIVEMPHGPDGPVEPAEGDQVQITFNAEERRLSLETVVRGPRDWHIGPATPVSAIELERPKRICELQRRADYRIPLSGRLSVIAHLEPLPIDSLEEGTIAEAFHAELHNISAGGVAAVVNPSVPACLVVGQHYMMDFYLPGCEEPFTFAVKIQHLRRLTHSGARLIGLKFIPGEDSELSYRALREIRSYVEVQRRLKS